MFSNELCVLINLGEWGVGNNKFAKIQGVQFQDNNLSKHNLFKAKGCATISDKQVVPFFSKKWICKGDFLEKKVFKIDFQGN